MTAPDEAEVSVAMVAEHSLSARSRRDGYRPEQHIDRAQVC